MPSAIKAVFTVVCLAATVTAHAQSDSVDSSDSLSQIDSQSEVTLPPPNSDSSEALPNEELVLAEGSWVTSASANPHGTFSLVGNANNPATAPETIHVHLGDSEPQSLKPHEVASWSCDMLEVATSLKVKNDAGDILYAGRFECGDAIYLKLRAP